ncbi:hypothetical protein [Thiocapsa marina]|uniref:hypothetical protein n=1 Tax=Thiocapsa marina TaxID=244573 RepID=UPI000593DBFE|nr:hypothetical protein [Thiocapsa marina]
MDRAKHRHAVAQARQDGQSQRAAVIGAGVARSTLRHWNASPAPLAPAALSAFVETPEGVVWLRRILVAAHWSIGEQGGAGVRVVCDFLERSGLSAFIGASYGTQQAFQTELEERIVTAAAELRGTLAQAMPHRLLSIAEDETWKDGMRLVGIDLVRIPRHSATCSTDIRPAIPPAFGHPFHGHSAGAVGAKRRRWVIVTRRVRSASTSGRGVCASTRL